MTELIRNAAMTAPTRDTHTNWSTHDPILPEGVFAITKDRRYAGSVEYFIGDGFSTYSELPKFGCYATADGKIDITLLPTKILETEPSTTDLSEGEIVYVVEA